MDKNHGCKEMYHASDLNIKQKPQMFTNLIRLFNSLTLNTNEQFLKKSGGYALLKHREQNENDFERTPLLQDFIHSSIHLQYNRFVIRIIVEYKMIIIVTQQKYSIKEAIV
ncbi:hypothetical protein GQR58_017140 [Nymphon striatum]|nr:hypothetical protein GQR58_017140 [Nymphon striatum]